MYYDRPKTFKEKVYSWLNDAAYIGTVVAFAGLLLSGCFSYISYDQQVFKDMYPNTTTGDYWWHALTSGG